MREQGDVGCPDRYVTTGSGIRICFRTAGDAADPAMLLIAGLGEDLDAWGEAFVQALVARGFHVITLDNRDVGQSSFLSTPPPALWRQVLARPRRDAYSLVDMAGDAMAVLDHLGIRRVHLVGRSMGGMIAQTLAATAAARVLSLTSLYSTTGARRVGQPAFSSIVRLCAAPPRDQEAAVRAHLRITRHVAGTAYAMDDRHEAALAARAWARRAGDVAAGSARQIQAIQKSGDRTGQLGNISAPTLVIHGDRDRLVAPSGGLATAKAIPGARHVVVPGMGHHLPAALVERITNDITRHARAATQGDAHVSH